MIRRAISDVRRYWGYAVYSAKSDLKSEVANSHLNWLWWILDPLLFMLVYSFISIIVFGKSEQYFPIFVFIGLNSWNMFDKTVKGSVKLVSLNRSIVSKVYLPKFILIISKMMVNAFKMLVAFSLVVIMMMIYRVPITVKILYIIPIFMVLLMVSFAFSTILLHFGVFVEDLANVVTVLLKLVFYLSGIFYNIVKRVPAPYNNYLLKINPMALIMNDLRNTMLYGADPHFKALALWAVLSIIISLVGMKIIYKYENSYVKVI